MMPMTVVNEQSKNDRQCISHRSLHPVIVTPTNTVSHLTQCSFVCVLYMMLMTVVKEQSKTDRQYPSWCSLHLATLQPASSHQQSQYCFRPDSWHGWMPYCFTFQEKTWTPFLYNYLFTKLLLTFCWRMYDCYSIDDLHHWRLTYPSCYDRIF